MSHLRVALQGGRVQRCHPVLVSQVGVCAGLQQVAGHERLAPLGGELQRRGTVLALVLCVGSKPCLWRLLLLFFLGNRPKPNRVGVSF